MKKKEENSYGAEVDAMIDVDPRVLEDSNELARILVEVIGVARKCYKKNPEAYRRDMEELTNPMINPKKSKGS